jgi:hypothetical protein
MYEKAVELYMYDHPEMENKPEMEELQEAGYIHTAKVLVLREVYLENKPKKQATSSEAEDTDRSELDQ